jgi:hypothetical protein
MGRERFVPIQMFLTRTLAPVLAAGTGLILVAAWLSELTLSAAVWTAAIAFAGALVNQQNIIPRALRAGGQGHRDIRGLDEEGSTAGFVSVGVGNKTATMHRLVVAFIVFMRLGLVPHGLILAGVIGR